MIIVSEHLLTGTSKLYDLDVMSVLLSWKYIQKKGRVSKLHKTLTFLVHKRDIVRALPGGCKLPANCSSAMSDILPSKIKFDAWL